VHGLRRLAAGLPAEALRPLKEAISYLEHQRPWIGSYELWKAQGYPVGSGIVALRTDLLNDDWVTPQRLRAFP